MSEQIPEEQPAAGNQPLGADPPAGSGPPGGGTSPPSSVESLVVGSLATVPQAQTVPTGDVVLTAEQQKRMDKLRAVISYWLLGLMTIVLGIAGATVFIHASATVIWSQGKEFMSIALPGVTGLLGTVIGFYFGSRAGQSAPTTPTS